MSIATAVGAPRARITRRAAVLLALVVFMAVLSFVPIREYFGQRGSIEALERKVAGLQSANADLQAKIVKLYDPAQLERLARECLGMVNPGETAFVAVPKGGKPKPPSC